MRGWIYYKDTKEFPPINLENCLSIQFGHNEIVFSGGSSLHIFWKFKNEKEYKAVAHELNKEFQKINLIGYNEDFSKKEMF
jgi:hypothetical protein